MTFLIAGAFFFAQRKGIGKGMYVFRKMIKKCRIGWGSVKIYAQNYLQAPAE